MEGTGLARLCDFGISSFLGDLSTYAQSTSKLGTIRYVSPELLTGVLEARNKGCDVWAFGCTSAEVRFLASDEAGTYQDVLKVLSKDRPYDWITNDWGLISAVIKSPPYVWPEPDRFGKCIVSCFEIDPERRPSSSELLE